MSEMASIYAVFIYIEKPIMSWIIRHSVLGHGWKVIGLVIKTT